MTAADDVVHGHTNTRRRTRTRLDDRLATAVVVFFPHPLETNKSGDGGRRKEGRNRNRCRRSSPASSHSIPDFQPSEEGRMFLSCFGFGFPVRQTLAPTKKRKKKKPINIGWRDDFSEKICRAAAAKGKIFLLFIDLIGFGAERQHL